MKTIIVKSMAYYKDEPSGCSSSVELIRCSSMEHARNVINDIIRDEWTTMIYDDAKDDEVSLADLRGYGEHDGKYASTSYSTDGLVAWDDTDSHYYHLEVGTIDEE